MLVMMAYDLRPYQLKAAEWMDSARYEVIAKIPVGATQAEFREMQQRFLADRLALKTHIEKREMAVYEVVVSNSGLKVKESDAAAATHPDLAWTPPAGGPPVRTMAHVKRKNQSMDDLARFLSDQLRQPVRDGTGLKSRYDWEFSFLMDPGGRAALPTAGDGTQPEFGTSLIDALREQLGLSLHRTRGLIDVLVVDSANKSPIEN